jgi:hypothetical protein
MSPDFLSMSESRVVIERKSLLEITPGAYSFDNKHPSTRNLFP